MQRHELEHLIRAAGAITGADEIIVIGSQAILPTLALRTRVSTLLILQTAIL